MKTCNSYFLVLDIETSKHSEYSPILNKEVPTAVWLSYGFIKLYDNKNNTIKKCMFRTWDILKKFLKDVSMSFFQIKVLCFVHNLSFEFDYLIKNVSKPIKFTCNSTHKVISATLEGYENIEFHCTYQLSAKSLRKIGKMINLEKLDDDYANVMPNESISNKRIYYCERDCDIVAKYICTYELKDYGMLVNIPLTSTGKVRKRLRELIKHNDKQFYWDIPPDENCVPIMNKCFRGAICISNPKYTGRLITDKVLSFDETSKYPSVMLTEQYPYTIKEMKDFKQDVYKEHKFWLARVHIGKMFARYQWGVLSASTCESFTIQSDIFNGKIINGFDIETYITSVDYDYLQKVYDIQDFTILEFFPCDDYDYLPDVFIALIEEFAKPKYELKQLLKTMDKESKEYQETEIEYMKSKNKLNSIYGMMVQKLTNPQYEIDNNYIWYETETPYENKEKPLFRNFLYGIFITAYSRRDWVYNVVENCPYNFVYGDTDSIKYIDEGKPFNDVNKPIREDLVDKPYFKNFNRFELDATYDKFLTFGSKKYCYEQDGNFHFTIAGLPKENNGKETQLKSFEDFRCGNIFHNCKKCTRYIYNKKYIDYDEDNNEILNISKMELETIQYLEDNKIDTNGGVALLDVDYKLNMTDADKFYITTYNDLFSKDNNYKLWI